VQRLIFPGFIFIVGVAIGSIYTPDVTAFSKNMDDINPDKQLQQNKSKPINLKTNKKKKSRYA